MSDLRKDPVTGRWVIVAPDRAKRPIHHEPVFRVTEDRLDPFAEGNEGHTPPEILAYRDPHSAPNGPGWRVRVIPNKFPALQTDEVLKKRGVGLYDTMTGVGAHEVVVECPHYEESLARLPEETVRDVLSAYKERLIDLKRDVRLVHGLIFKNKGALARGEFGARAQPTDRDRCGADLRVGGDAGGEGVLRVPRPVRVSGHSGPRTGIQGAGGAGNG